MIKLGNLTLSSNIFYAPLAGCSDYPFRKMGAKYRPGLMYTEMVKMDALVRHDQGTYRLLDYNPDMRAIGAQLCGSKPKIAAEAARIIEDLGFDVLDLNCGCPVDKVTKDGSGSGLLKTPNKIGDILSEMANAVSIPVTVKIRCGWDEASFCTAKITQIAELAGAKAIAVHGRTRVQGYKGASNWAHILEAKQAANEILVIGNGDVFTPEDAKRMFEETGCDAVLVSRGTLGQPFIAENIRRLMENKPLLTYHGTDYRDLLLDHYHEILAYQDERKALIDLRRVGCWYLRSGVGTKKLREALNKAKSTKEVKDLFETYGWEDAYYR